jgi:hypothetical protein
MINEETRAKAYVTLRAAIWGLADGVLSFEQFANAIQQLRDELDAKVLEKEQAQSNE